MALDDFGTGYSSLSYLTRFPIDTLKIDRSFVVNVPEEECSCDITATIMAKALGMTVIAEGVENQAQLNFLREQGCHIVQGYVISEPVMADEIPALLASPAFF